MLVFRHLARSILHLATRSLSMPLLTGAACDCRVSRREDRRVVGAGQDWLRSNSEEHRGREEDEVFRTHHAKRRH